MTNHELQLNWLTESVDDQATEDDRLIDYDIRLVLCASLAIIQIFQLIITVKFFLKTRGIKEVTW